MLEVPTYQDDGYGSYAKAYITPSHIIAIEPAAIGDQNYRRWANASRIHLSTGVVIECSLTAARVNEALQKAQA